MPRKIKMTESISQDTIAELYAKFINHCVVSNYSTATISHYRDTIHNFSLFTDINEVKTDDLSDDLIEEYTKYLQRKKTRSGVPLRGKTIATYLTGIRTILNWAHSEGLIKRIKVVIPRYDQSLKKTYTEQQLKALVVKPDVKTCDFANIRDWALVSYLLGTGQRLSTVINIRIQDVSFNENTVALHKLKNRTQVILPLASSVIATLKVYLKYRRGKPDDFLFCNSVGNQLSTRGAQDAVAFYNKNHGVSLTSIHAFRHTFAKRALLAGMDIVTLQHLLTHMDLNSTRVYLSMTTEDLREGLNDYNPLSKLQREEKGSKIRIDRDE